MGSCLPSETLELLTEGPRQEHGMWQAGTDRFGHSEPVGEFLSWRFLFTLESRRPNHLFGVRSGHADRWKRLKTVTVKQGE